MGNNTNKNLKITFYAINIFAYPLLIFFVPFVTWLLVTMGDSDAMSSLIVAELLLFYGVIFVVIITFFGSIIAAGTYLNSYIPAIISLVVGMALSSLLFSTAQIEIGYALIVLVLALMLLILVVYSSKKKFRMSKQYKSEGFGQVETHDFNKSIEKQIDISLYNDDWVVSEPEIRVLHLYAPAADFYMIRKEYYSNGVIKKRGMSMCNLKFGKWECFDKEGDIIKVIDEDKKIKGVEVTREDVLNILEKEGWFNRKTGEQKVLIYEGKIKTDGSFYMKLSRNIHIWLDAAVVKNGEEILPPVWGVSISSGVGIKENYVYNINGHTGEYTVNHISIPAGM